MTQMRRCPTNKMGSVFKVNKTTVYPAKAQSREARDYGRVATGSSDKTARLWDAATGQGLQTIDAQIVSPTFSFFISSASPCSLQDCCGRPLCWLANDFSTSCCVFSPNERFVAIATTRHQVLTIDLGSYLHNH